MKINQIVRLFFLCVIVIYYYGYSAVRGPNYDDIRALGMGNTTVPITTDRTAIFHNPAGLGLIKDYIQFSFSPLAFSIDGIFFTLLQQMVEHGDKLSDLSKVDEDFLNMLNKYDGQWVGLEYIPEITVATRNMGFGIYSVFPAGVRIESGHLIPKLALRGRRDLVFTWAAGFPLHSDKHCIGFSVEYFQRTTLEMMTKYSETFILFDEIANRPFGIINDYAEIKHGASLDVGFMHNLFKGFRLAWDAKDILGVVGGEFVVPPQVDVGCAYYFPQMEKVKAIKNLIAGFEITNLFGVEPVTEKYEQFFKKMHFGAEIDMHYAALRLGVSQGYPTIGVGLRFGMFKTDYVFFTEELGYYAGQLPKKQHILSFGVEFSVADSKKDRATIRAMNLYNKAMNLYHKGKYYDAFFIYGKILVEYPDFFKNDWVQLYLGLCQENMDMREFSKINLVKTKKDYPKSPVVPHADLGLLRLHYRNGNSLGVAQQFVELNTAQVPDSIKYHAYYYQGQTHLLNKKPREAIELFKRIPQNHPEYLFAQHSMAVAYAITDTLGFAIRALDNVVQSVPDTKAEEEIINRSFVFLGYIYYESLREQKRALSHAVAALRKVPKTSYYYEDALLGLAWCGLSAGQWSDCQNACATLKKVSNKPVIHYEALLLEAYIQMLKKKFKEAIAILSEAEKSMGTLNPPSETNKNAATLEYTNTRKEYYNVAAEVNRLAFTEQSSVNVQRIDSLHAPQIEHESKLHELAKFFDEYKRHAFFARNIKKVRDDIAYALLKAEKMAGDKKVESTIKDAVKKTKQIDKEVKKLKEELKEIEAEEEEIDTGKGEDE